MHQVHNPLVLLNLLPMLLLILLQLLEQQQQELRPSPLSRGLLEWCLLLLKPSYRAPQRRPSPWRLRAKEPR